MSTTTRKLPPHGTTARYAGDKRSGKPPCFCAPCRQAGRRWKKRRKLVGPLTTGTSAVRAHLRTLIGKGATRQSIADASGCNVGTVKYILDGRYTTIRATTAARLLAVTDASIGHAMTDATGSVRRVRALMAIGRECTDIIAFGINHRLVSGLVNGKVAQIQRDKADVVARAFTALAMTPGPSLRNRRRAEREGWAPPLAWTNIDDPNEIPTGWERRDERYRAEDLVEDAQFIIATTGADLDLIAERLGVKRNTLEKAHERVAARAKRQRVAA